MAPTKKNWTAIIIALILTAVERKTMNMTQWENSATYRLIYLCVRAIWKIRRGIKKMVITMAIACVTTSAAVSIATTKILAAYYFKIVDSYVDEKCKETRRFVNEACEEINRR